MCNGDNLYFALKFRVDHVLTPNSKVTLPDLGDKHPLGQTWTLCQVWNTRMLLAIQINTSHNPTTLRAESELMTSVFVELTVSLDQPEKIIVAKIIVNFIGHLPCGMYCPKCFSSKLMHLFYTWENWGPVRLKDLLRTIHQVNDRSRIWTHIDWPWACITDHYHLQKFHMVIYDL